MRTDHPWRDYLAWMFAAAFAAIAASAAFTLFMDPLALYGAPRVAGVNAVKPYLDHHRQLARWHAARRACATVGFFGNSRAEIGFDPEAPVLKRQGLVAFNHAIPGSGLGLAARQLGWIEDAGCGPRVVVLGVDFFDFLGGPAPEGAASAAPPRVDARVVAETVFSVTAVRDAFTTLGLQHARYPATLTPLGFNPLLNYIPEVGKSGHYALFRQRAVENRKRWEKLPARLDPPGGGPSEEALALERFLARARPAQAVHLVIYPYHAEIRLMLEAMGLTGLFEEWKARVLAQARAADPTGTRVRVWDFSGLSPETLEPIPAPHDRRTALQWYWEAGHFKKALGDRMLARMLDESDPFGVELRSETLAATVAQDRRRVTQAWRAGGPLVREVESVLRQR